MNSMILISAALFLILMIIAHFQFQKQPGNLPLLYLPSGLVLLFSLLWCAAVLVRGSEVSPEGSIITGMVSAVILLSSGVLSSLAITVLVFLSRRRR